MIQPEVVGGACNTLSLAEKDVTRRQARHKRVSVPDKTNEVEMMAVHDDTTETERKAV